MPDVETGSAEDGGPVSFEPFGSVPEMVQLLTPEGIRVEDDRFRSDGDAAQARSRLRDMVLARRLDTEATALQRKGELALWPPLLGQEAAQVGSARALGDRDVVFPSYREHAVALCLGAPWRNLLALMRGCDQGDWEHLDRFRNYALVIGTQTLHATGYAMGMMYDGLVGNPDPGDNAAVIAYHGDGASSQGDVNEAYVFAASYRAPVVFFCQNNQWAISEPIGRQSTIPLFRRAQGFGFPGVQVDGNDVLAVEAVTSWALERAHSGQGPTFVEAYTYRRGAHTTADDPTKYRLAEENEHWEAKDPIRRVVAWLRREDEIDDAHLARLDEEADDFAAEIRSSAQGLAEKGMDELFGLVYAHESAPLAAQRAQWARYAATLEEA